MTADSRDEIVRAVLTAVAGLLPDVAQLVEAAGRTLGTEVTVLARGGDGDAVRRSAGRAIAAMQFQDRHAQLLEDATAILRRAALLEEGDEAMTLDRFCATIKMSEVRARVLAAAGRQPLPPPPVHGGDDIDLF